MDDHLRARLLELLEPVPLDALVLNPQHAWMLPFAVGRIFHIADDGLEFVGLEIVAELLLVEAADRRDSLGEHLAVGIGEGRDKKAERIHAARDGLLLIALEEVADAGERHRRLRNVEVVVDDLVQELAELRLERRILQSDHAAAEELGLEADLVCRTHDPDGVGRIRGDVDEIRIGGVDGAHDRREIERARRIAAIVDDLEAHLECVVARPVGRLLGEVGIGADDRHGAELLRLGDLEVATRELVHGVGASGKHGEIVRVVEGLVDREREQTHQHVIARDHDRHRGYREIGAVAGQRQIDLVDVEQLGVDARHQRGVALVVVVDELDRTPDEAALGVDVLLPHLIGGEDRLAVGGKPAGERHREADLDRVGRVHRRSHAGERERRNDHQPPGGHEPSLTPVHRRCSSLVSSGRPFSYFFCWFRSARSVLQSCPSGCDPRNGGPVLVGVAVGDGVHEAVAQDAREW